VSGGGGASSGGGAGLIPGVEPGSKQSLESGGGHMHGAGVSATRPSRGGGNSTAARPPRRSVYAARPSRPSTLHMNDCAQKVSEGCHRCIGYALLSLPRLQTRKRAAAVLLRRDALLCRNIWPWLSWQFPRCRSARCRLAVCEDR